MYASTTSRINGSATSQSIIRLSTSNTPSPAPFLLINHLLMHLLPLILLFAGNRVLELFDVLIQELFLCLLLVLSVIALVRDLLHHRVDFFGVGL